MIARIVLLVTLLSQPMARAAAPPGGESYISRLRETIHQARFNLPALTNSADLAAREFLLGGNLWAAGRQPDFIAEACGRAGGLVAIAPLADHVPTNHEIVLYANAGPLAAGDLDMVRRWREQGATVVTFSSEAGMFDENIPVDTVANVIDLWTWTGEFVAACARRGAMPVLYKSYGLPGGYERARKYQGRRLHDDLTIQPIPAGVLGRQYLNNVEGMLARIDSTQMPKLLQAARWWREARSATTLVTGHMFPVHFQDPRTPHISDLASVPAGEDKELLDGNHPPSFVLSLGYQFAPRKLVNQAASMGVKLAYCAVEPNQPPEPANGIVYIDPGWPLADGCVTVPGYDVPILPASGVMQAAIYWTIASGRLKPASHAAGQ